MNRLSAMIFFIAQLALIAPAQGLSTGNDAADAYVRSKMQERPIPGVAVAVIRGGRLLKLTAYGTASLEFGTPATIDTLFNVASVSKAFTAVGVLCLVQDRRLALDDPVGRHLPDLPVNWRTVTVRQLLNHTSGLPVIDADAFSTRTLAQTIPAALDLLGPRPFLSAPGTKWTYNQTNYMLLGMLIEKLTSRAFAEFCRTRLFEPFGLKTPVFGDSRAVVRNRATVYTRFRFDSIPPKRIEHSEVLDYSMPDFMHPAAGLNISIKDFAQWLLALEQNRIVSRRLLEALWEPARYIDGALYEGPPPRRESYGLGWVLKTHAEHPSVGGTGGLRAAFALYPRDNLSVIVLTNFQGAGPEALVEDVAALYFNQGTR